MGNKRLEEELKNNKNFLNMLYNQKQIRGGMPITPAEFSNWRDEQRAWRETAVLFDQTWHMSELSIEGPDAVKLISSLGINSFAGDTVNRAKHFSVCSYDGNQHGEFVLGHGAAADEFSVILR